MSFSVLHIKKYMISAHPVIGGDVNIAHLVKVVSARFPTAKITFSPLRLVNNVRRFFETM